MKRNRIPSVLFHILATLCLSCGFVKAAEYLDLGTLPAPQYDDASEPADLIGSLPCGNKRPR